MLFILFLAQILATSITNAQLHWEDYDENPMPRDTKMQMFRDNYGCHVSIYKLLTIHSLLKMRQLVRGRKIRNHLVSHYQTYQNYNCTELKREISEITKSSNNNFHIRDLDEIIIGDDVSKNTQQMQSVINDNMMDMFYTAFYKKHFHNLDNQFLNSDENCVKNYPKTDECYVEYKYFYDIMKKFDKNIPLGKYHNCEGPLFDISKELVSTTHYTYWYEDMFNQNVKKIKQYMADVKNLQTNKKKFTPIPSDTYQLWNLTFEAHKVEFENHLFFLDKTNLYYETLFHLIECDNMYDALRLSGEMVFFDIQYSHLSQYFYNNKNNKYEKILHFVHLMYNDKMKSTFYATLVTLFNDEYITLRTIDVLLLNYYLSIDGHLLKNQINFQQIVLAQFRQKVVANKNHEMIYIIASNSSYEIQDFARKNHKIFDFIIRDMINSITQELINEWHVPYLFMYLQKFIEEIFGNKNTDKMIDYIKLIHDKLRTLKISAQTISHDISNLLALMVSKYHMSKETKLKVQAMVHNESSLIFFNHVQLQISDRYLCAEPNVLINGNTLRKLKLESDECAATEENCYWEFKRVNHHFHSANRFMIRNKKFNEYLCVEKNNIDLENNMSTRVFTWTKANEEVIEGIWILGATGITFFLFYFL